MRPRISVYVAELARRHGVVYVRTLHDALAEVITQLSDDEIATDETENLPDYARIRDKMKGVERA
jgi:hypothetical protein